MAGKNADRSGLFVDFFEPFAGTSEAYDAALQHDVAGAGLTQSVP